MSSAAVMASLSIVVAAYNCAATIEAALASAAEALAYFQREQARSAGAAVATEVVVVDDGSTDDTHDRVAAVAAAAGENWQVVRQVGPSSPARARNAGVRQARGEVLFFLDGDDLFLPPHVAVCWRTLMAGDLDYVKTGVLLADPVHPDWKQRIERTVVLNLCVRRAAHEAFGGFPDYHLCRYDEGNLRPELDIFYKIEDVYYNYLLGELRRGCLVTRETVEYRRYPGNAYDRQYAKFCRPIAESRGEDTREERLRRRLSEAVAADLAARRRQPSGTACGENPLPSRQTEADGMQPSPVNTVKALVQAGVGLAGQGRREEALALLERAVGVQPTSAWARHNLGVALAQAGRHEESVRVLEEALRLRPDYADAYFNLGNALRELGRRDEAVTRFRQALRLRPDHAGACNNLGLTLTEANRAAEAVAPLQRAVALQPDQKEGHNNLGLAYADLGRFAEAEACYHEALRLDPGYVEAHTNLGSVCKEQGRLEEALACYQYALYLEPESAIAHYNRALTWLQQGDYARGWPEYEWRWRRPTARPRAWVQPRWDGTPLPDGTLLLWREQGLGDTIQFIRYAALARRLCGRVVVVCPGCLLPLLSRCVGIDHWVAEGQALPEGTAQLPLLSLPGLWPQETMAMPYLQAEAERVASWRGRLGAKNGLRVGVVWQGNPHCRGDHQRSFPLAALAPLAAVSGVQLISLQKEHGLEQLATRTFPLTVLPGLDEAGGAFLDTAAVMGNLDLVVTPDTAVGHLAGALGVPVWLALSRAPDWRWGLSGETTRWYPSMRLFRQTRLGDWTSLFQHMARCLGRQGARTRS